MADNDPLTPDPNLSTDTPTRDPEPNFTATDPAIQTPPETPSASTTFRDYMADKGYDVSGYDNDEGLLNELEQGYQAVQSGPTLDQIQQFQQMQPVLSEYAASASEFEQWKQAQQNAPEPQTQAPAVPTVSDTAKAMLQIPGAFSMDEHGLVKAKDPYLQRYADEENRARQYRRQQSQRLLENPTDFLMESGLKDTLDKSQKQLREELKAEILNELQQQHSVQKRDQYFEQNATKLFETDDTGQVRFNPQTNEPIPSALGKVYQQAQQQQLDLLKRSGVDNPDPAILHEAGLAAIALHESMVPATPEKTRTSKQQQFIDRARTNGHGVNRLTERDHSVAAAAAAEQAQNEMDEDALWDATAKQALAELT